MHLLPGGGLKEQQIRRLILAFVLAQGCLVAGVARAAVSPALKLTGDRAAHGWVSVLPDDSKVQGQIFKVESLDRTVALAGVPAGVALVCAGGDGAATLCQRI